MFLVFVFLTDCLFDFARAFRAAASLLQYAGDRGVVYRLYLLFIGWFVVLFIGWFDHNMSSDLNLPFRCHYHQELISFRLHLCLWIFYLIFFSLRYVFVLYHFFFLINFLSKNCIIIIITTIIYAVI